MPTLRDSLPATSSSSSSAMTPELERLALVGQLARLGAGQQALMALLEVPAPPQSRVSTPGPHVEELELDTPPRPKRAREADASDDKSSPRCVGQVTADSEGSSAVRLRVFRLGRL